MTNSNGPPALADPIQQRLSRAAAFSAQMGRPYVTLTYAQTLDGSLTAQAGQPLNISSEQSHTFTHALRANHDAILVGINTVLADDPLLTVRRVAGPNPHAVVLDSRLRFPSQARLLQNPTRPLWVMTTDKAPRSRQAELESQGARVFRVATNSQSQVDLAAALAQLHQVGVSRLMVEGGAQVITNFLKARLVDQLIVTVAPRLVGGLRAVGPLSGGPAHALPHLENIHQERLADDYIIRGDLSWPAP